MNTTKLTAETITDDQITALRREAAITGDVAMVAICDRALRGEGRAREQCAAVIDDARAMGD